MFSFTLTLTLLMIISCSNGAQTSALDWFHFKFGPSFFMGKSFLMTNKKALKPHRSYAELVDLLKSKGMTIKDPARAERKLSQIGYYRLKGF